MQIRGILFDIGDTLLGATSLQQIALKETVSSLTNGEWIKDADSFIRAYQTADREPKFDEMADLNHLYSDVRIIARAFQLLSLSFDPPRARHFLEFYRSKVRENLRPNIELIELLDGLQARGLKLGIVSNGTLAEQTEQLTLLKIKHYFDPILISEEVGVRKPNPEIFLRAAHQWQLQPATILVVGDREDWEVLGASRAGMLSALTTQFVDHRTATSSGVKPDFTINHFSHLLDLVRRQDDTPSLRRRESSNQIPQG